MSNDSANELKKLNPYLYNSLNKMGIVDEDYPFVKKMVIEDIKMNKFKYIVWVGGVDDYYINYLDAKRDYDNWINQGYNDVCIESIGKNDCQT